MRLLFVADGRSPITLNWIRYFIERGDVVHLVSSFACDPIPGLGGLEVLPVAFSSMKKTTGGRPGPARMLAARTLVRQWLGPLTLRRAAARLRAIIQRVQPDLVHTMRIPYEGMLAAEGRTEIPLIVSVWGNDFTLHGVSTPLMRHYTEWTLQAADALHADCHRDIRLARQWGYGTGKPTLVIPTNGGPRMDVFHPPAEPVGEPVVFNPRGFRAYVRNDMFFKAIPLILEKHPGARFRCAAMAGEPQALQWCRELGIEAAVELLPPLPHAGMAEIFRSAQVVVSPTTHDGTPNSLLEGMACGCFPVAGDLESVREWITPGQNGLLCDPGSPSSIAEAVLSALKNESLRRSAAGQNLKMLAARAEYDACMQQAASFYNRAAGIR